jgi:hypothetical protein
MAPPGPDQLDDEGDQAQRNPNTKKVTAAISIQDAQPESKKIRFYDQTRKQSAEAKA